MPDSDIIVIAAHPDLAHSRVARSLLDAIDAADFAPERLQVRDLYQLYADYAIDVATEQRALKHAKLLVWLHPMHWWGMPALMKLWVDEVLTHGWAYGPGQRALRGKQVWLVLSTGGAVESFSAEGYNGHALESYLLPYRQMARLCGLHPLPPLVLHAAHEVTTETLNTHAATLVAQLQRYPQGFEAAETSDMPLCWLPTEDSNGA